MAGAPWRPGTRDARPPPPPVPGRPGRNKLRQGVNANAFFVVFAFFLFLCFFFSVSDFGINCSPCFLPGLAGKVLGFQARMKADVGAERSSALWRVRQRLRSDRWLLPPLPPPSPPCVYEQSAQAVWAAGTTATQCVSAWCWQCSPGHQPLKKKYLKSLQIECISYNCFLIQILEHIFCDRHVPGAWGWARLRGSPRGGSSIFSCKSTEKKLLILTPPVGPSEPPPQGPLVVSADPPGSEKNV